MGPVPVNAIDYLTISVPNGGGDKVYYLRRLFVGVPPHCLAKGPSSEVGTAYGVKVVRSSSRPRCTRYNSHKYQMPNRMSKMLVGKCFDGSLLTRVRIG